MNAIKKALFKKNLLSSKKLLKKSEPIKGSDF